jgi:hypothetical protein
MVQPAWKDAGSIFAGILVWFAIIYVLGLKNLWPVDANFPFLQGIALLSMAYWGAFLAVRAGRRLSSWRGSWKVCEHNVPGGKNRLLCPHCRDLADQREAERIAAELAAKVAEQERLRRQDLKRKAEELASSELKRLFGFYVPTLSQLRSLTPQAFEDCIAGMFLRLGYSVEQTPYSNDYGRDAIMMRDGRKALLECKRYGEVKPLIANNFKNSIRRSSWIKQKSASS